MCYYNGKNQTIRTLLSWNLHTRPLALLMENVAQSLAQDPHFSQLENKSSEAQSRRLYKNNSRGVNSASREGICISYLPDQNHRSTIYQPQPWSMTKREATTRQLLEASAEQVQSCFLPFYAICWHVHKWLCIPKDEQNIPYYLIWGTFWVFCLLAKTEGATPDVQLQEATGNNGKSWQNKSCPQNLGCSRSTRLQYGSKIFLFT